MNNLHKLKKGEPFSEVVIKHDMSREDREKERLLQKEVREKTPYVIAISEVKPKHSKRQLTLQEYNLEGYSMETINMNENKCRGMILFIHNSLPFQAHHFEVDFNEALFSP